MGAAGVWPREPPHVQVGAPHLGINRDVRISKPKRHMYATEELSLFTLCEVMSYSQTNRLMLPFAPFR